MGTSFKTGGTAPVLKETALKITARAAAIPGLLFLALGGLGGCAAPGHAHESRWVQTELFFGASRPDGGTVSEKEWKRFLDTEITPRFPDGLTVLDASGQWRTRAGKPVSEHSRLLLLIHRPAPEDRARIEAIRERYKRRFHQESVLEATVPVHASF